MGKKKRKNKKNRTIGSKNSLPQNIVLIGERVEEDKNIYISQPVYKEIHKFTQSKTTNESGCILIGTIIEDFGKKNIIIDGFIEAKYSDATPTTLKFTHETWDYVHKRMDIKYPDKKIVGWIHTHPDFGVFLSEYDKFIHENFFSEDYQIAYVVDPVQDVEVFFFWINGKLERCKGFYIFDKNGVKISVDTGKKSVIFPKAKAIFPANNIIIIVLVICVIVLLISNILMGEKIKNIQNQQKAIVNSANQSLANMQSQIDTLFFQLKELNLILTSTEELDTTVNDTQ
ncbi:MAG: metal-dependent protease of the PAD1/JAB1 superfamily [Acutalibacteraceae bacterium]|jgi:proteasome lid subunit RPN8/RPN11